MKAIPKQSFLAFIDLMIQDDSLDVQGVVAKENKFVFRELDSSSELRLDYDTTILPPKKYFLPQYEPMMKFDLNDPTKVEFLKSGKKKIIIGIHPHDMRAIKQMDKYYLESSMDDLYLQKRKNSIVICSVPLNATDRAFYGSLVKARGGKIPELGCDLMVCDLGDTVVVSPGTEPGNTLLAKAQGVRDASPEEMQKFDATFNQAIEKTNRPLTVGPKGWHSLLISNYDHPLWKEQSDKCLTCGSCTLVCPTCFCYDVTDELNLDMTTGIRSRTWDGCLLRNFTVVAGGEVFRETKEARYRHRFNRKGKYLLDRFGFVACVGCGRCATDCPPDIADPVNLFNKLAATGTPTTSAEVKMPNVNFRATDVNEKLFAPIPATLKRIEKLTEKETLFEVSLDNGQPLGHQPGQFVEVSILGIGEAPISVSSAPGGNTFELVVRLAGDVTRALHGMNVGDKVGIRGPFGTGFDAEEMKGKDLLFVAAGLGIAPLRSLFNYVLNNRGDYGKVNILYGCKEPCEMLFKDEVAAWDQRQDIIHHLTVDKCPEGECWNHNIGVVGTLIPKVQFDPATTVAIVVGPPVVYKFVTKDLIDAGVKPENIIVSLERRMKCGVGKCGHCQINGIYVCKEGPVFNFSKMQYYKEAF